MAIIKIEDEKSSLKALVFPDLYNQYIHLLKEGAMLWFKGEVDKEEENKVLLIEDLAELKDLRFFKNGRLNILFSSESIEEENLEYLKNFLIKEENLELGLPIQLYLKYPDSLVCFEINGYKIDPSYEHLSLLLETLEGIRLKVVY
jgi:DNA polymerase-3 subunit alpha